MNTAVLYYCIVYIACVSAQSLESIRKNPECLLPEDPGFCTPVIRYGVAPLVYPALTTTCVPYAYYGEGGNRGFDDFTTCIYACGSGPLVSILQAGK